MYQYNGILKSNLKKNGQNIWNCKDLFELHGFFGRSGKTRNFDQWCAFSFLHEWQMAVGIITYNNLIIRYHCYNKASISTICISN